MRDGGRCQFPHGPSTVGCDGWAGLEIHHVKPRSVCSKGERWSPDNLVLLCRSSHGWVTANGSDARSLGLHAKSWDRVVGGRVARGL